MMKFVLLTLITLLSVACCRNAEHEQINELKTLILDKFAELDERLNRLEKLLIRNIEDSTKPQSNFEIDPILVQQEKRSFEEMLRIQKELGIENPVETKDADQKVSDNAKLFTSGGRILNDFISVRDKQLQEQDEKLVSETKSYRWSFLLIFLLASGLELATEPLLNFLQGTINYSSPNVDFQLRVVGKISDLVFILKPLIGMLLAYNYIEEWNVVFLRWLPSNYNLVTYYRADFGVQLFVYYILGLKCGALLGYRNNLKQMTSNALLVLQHISCILLTANTSHWRGISLLLLSFNTGQFLLNLSITIELHRWIRLDVTRVICNIYGTLLFIRVFFLMHEYSFGLTPGFILFVLFIIFIRIGDIFKGLEPLVKVKTKKK